MVERPIVAILGQRVAHLRGWRGMTQDDLAATIGMARSSIANIEAGRQEPSLANLVAIAAALGTSVDTLITEPSDADRAIVGQAAATAKLYVLAALDDAERRVTEGIRQAFLAARQTWRADLSGPTPFALLVALASTSAAGPSDGGGSEERAA